jgi:hypothetical protein
LDADSFLISVFKALSKLFAAPSGAVLFAATEFKLPSPVGGNMSLFLGLFVAVGGTAGGGPTGGTAGGGPTGGTAGGLFVAMPSVLLFNCILLH